MCRIEQIPLPAALPDVQTTWAPPIPSAFKIRVFSAALFTAVGSMLATGMWLTPNPAGLGTHTQLGLPVCGFYAKYGIPCPLCGYTTAVSYIAHGHVLGAIITQPAGAAVGLLAVAALALGFLGLFRGRWYGPSLFWFLWHRNTIAIYLFLLVLGAWMYKVALMTS
ncbi:MAG TPA: DUF2752 domain-containing protein [Phycisphaerae bacterium]|nr:DUF2752 domain-containing protein [Phycisphaerae bacterium]